MLKKTFIAALCSVVCCLAVTLWIVPRVKETRAAGAPASSGMPSVSQTDSSSGATYLYRIGESGGCVAVFDAKSDQPFLVLDTPLSSLPEKDQQQIRAGIPVQTTVELQALLEDYS